MCNNVQYMDVSYEGKQDISKESGDGFGFELSHLNHHLYIKPGWVVIGAPVFSWQMKDSHGIPILNMQNPGGHYYWEGGWRPQIIGVRGTPWKINMEPKDMKAWFTCAMVKVVAILGMVIPPLIGILIIMGTWW